jgi:hypothetical protein
MTDYFASLLRQTGIKTKPDHDAIDQDIENQLTESDDVNAVAQDESEEYEMIELLPPETIKDDNRTVSRYLAPPAKELKKERDEHIVIGDIAPLLSKSSSRSSELKSEVWQDQNMQKSKLAEDDSGVRRPPEREFTQSQPPAEETSTRPRTIETEMMEKVRPLHHSSVPATGVPRKTSPISNKTGQDRGISREQILQTVYDEVRGWVASQTEVRTEDHRSLVAAEVTREIDRSLPRTLDQKQDAVFFHSRDKDLPDRSDEVGIGMQHVHLSIGPINVSIEGSERNAQIFKPVQRDDARSMMEARSSRLKRHYIFP